MKKIIRAIVSVALVLTIFVSCGPESPESNDTADSIDPMRNFLIVYDQDLSGMHAYVIRDSNTDVLYMLVTAYQKGGLTPLINADRSPVTYSQWISEEGGIE